jgi:hypothetical protein
VEIEKDVPLPSSGRSTKYPFVRMSVGDSVFFPNEQINGKAYRAAKSCGDRNGRTFVARREGEGIRIWRQS